MYWKLNTLNFHLFVSNQNPYGHFSTVLRATHWLSICATNYYCSGLTEVHANRETPPATGYDIFSECWSLETIYVPTGASANYGIDPWNAYKIVEEEVQSGIAAVTVEGETAVPVYHLNGSRAGTMKNFSAQPKGIYIVKGKKVLR